MKARWITALARLTVAAAIVSFSPLATADSSNTDYSSAANYARSSENGVGSVASIHPLATQAGINALQQGGNAIDAAVAVALTLGVVDNHNSGIGNGNFAVIRYADGNIEAIDGREMAPQAAHRDMYLRDGKAERALSQTGALAVGVPGALVVYDYLLNRAGKLSLKDVLLPAADIAEQGFPLSAVSHARISSNVSAIQMFPETAAILLDAKGQPWPAGHNFVQQDLAKTYRELAEQGIDYFYRGAFTKALIQWMEDNGGILTAEDMANYKMLIREPVKSDYRGYTVYGFPPPSSGGVHVAQILNMLERYDIAALSEADRYHLLAEAMRLAFADRAHFLGDPDFVKVPKGLIAKSYAEQLSNGISFNKAAVDISHGNPPKADIDFFGKHTTHISTADKWGNWVAITTTLNTSFGSKVVIPGTGVLLNNQMDDFSSQPGVPNAFGLVGNEANSIQPGKRPLSSMSPTLVMKGNQPIISIGAAGGPTIITQVLQGIVNMLDLGMTVEQALATPRVHNQWLPQVTMTEEILPQATREALEQRGHKIYLRPYNGTTQAIYSNDGKVFEAAAEPRIIQQNKAAKSL
ncbi:gamma-glutamyltransferase [Oceanicoccus sagamiensis]|uniref:Glutathione hydrolase proenzyme n=1 Tax=Oceanicoccus sagamiensis TaxID=716816 RepID=A0A1X9NKY7_9GAMM|nr:gamma-glutamyltransferase [Oceanicoccus sagamiensis]ARN74613.1 gamma-glutamyltransferase [Oceanicoccus sagamiensis]